MSEEKLHPIVAAAARGRLPAWAAVGPARRRHLASVADLMDRWARDLGLGERDRSRWLAAAWLHDALRDADPDDLKGIEGYPPPLRHGPAVAHRLAEAGVDDPELLDALRYHTLGHPDLERLGRFLYLADYLDPSRPFDPAGRAALRARLPEQESVVLWTVCRDRISYLLAKRLPLRPETVAFWNRLRSGS